jgi:hexosaminidase
MKKRQRFAGLLLAGAMLSVASSGCGGSNNGGGGGGGGSAGGGTGGGGGGAVDGGTGDAAVSPAQALVDNIAATTQVGFVVIENIPMVAGSTTVTDCPANAPGGLCFSGKITLKNTGADWNGSGWAIYYSSIRKVLSVDNPDFTITHVNGDMHKIEPTATFAGFKAGETKEIPLKAEYWMISETDVMPRFYVVADGAQATVIASTAGDDVSAIVAPLTDPKQTKRTPSDISVMATATTRFTANGAVADVGSAAVAAEVVPTPAKVTAGTGTLDLSTKGITLSTSALGADSIAAIVGRLTTFGVNTVASGGVPVTVTVDATNPAFLNQKTAEAYTLKVTSSGVTIVGGDAAGAFYGLETLAGLLTASGKALPIVSVDYDAPRYGYRGVQIDVARNFHSLTELLKVIDQLAAYKLNTIHLHLSDDEGWRLEIPGLPELTTPGSVRCYDPTEKSCILPQLGSGPGSTTSGTGHLSRADFVQLLTYAKARYISVQPELDMPGHVRAAIKAMQLRAAGGDSTYLLSDPNDTSQYLSTQYYDDNALNGCMDSTYVFIGKVMDEVLSMYKDAGATLTTWHVGGDEVGDGAWTASPVCTALFASGGDVKSAADVHGHFIRTVNGLAKTRGLGIRGWSDGMRKTVLDANNMPTKVFLDPTLDLAGNAASVNWWGTLFWWDNSVYSLANLGYRVILTPPDFLYFDHPYEADPMERGYYWATRFTDVHKLFAYMPANLPANSQLTVDRQGANYTAAFVPTTATPTPVIPLVHPENVAGLEGALWSETVRSDDNVDYMVFPRALALAERAWHRGAWEAPDGIQYDATVDQTALAADWQRFANVLGHKELDKLEASKVAYRIEVPGAQIVNGALSANVAMPGLTIQYQAAGGAWVAYDPANPPKLTTTQVRALTHGGRAGRAVSVP